MNARGNGMIWRAVSIFLLGICLAVFSNSLALAILISRGASRGHVSVMMDVHEIRSVTFMQSYENGVFPRLSVNRSDGGDLKSIAIDDLRTAVRARWQAYSPSFVGPPIQETLVPDWMTWPPPVDLPISSWDEGVTGWPYHCLRVRQFSAGGLMRAAPPGVPRFAPWWPGVWRNLAVHGAAWLVIVIMFTQAWSRWRCRILRRHTHRGECPSCRYQRAGLPAAAPCPECGHSRR